MIENFLMTILKVTLLTSLVDIFSSVFKLKNYITLVSNFIILSILISPFTGLDINDIKFEETLEQFFYVDENKINEKDKTISKSIDESNYTSEVFEKDIIEENYESLILEYLNETNIHLKNIEVEIEDDFSKINEIKIEVITKEEGKGDEKDYNKYNEKNLKTQISNILEIDEDLIKIDVTKEGKKY